MLLSLTKVIVCYGSGGPRGDSLGSDEPPPLRPDPGVVAENARIGCIRVVH